eukprot:363863-Chlamydomonas_euryale.AAC.10
MAWLHGISTAQHGAARPSATRRSTARHGTGTARHDAAGGGTLCRIVSCRAASRQQRQLAAGCMLQLAAGRMLSAALNTFGPHAILTYPAPAASPTMRPEEVVVASTTSLAGVAHLRAASLSRAAPQLLATLPTPPTPLELRRSTRGRPRRAIDAMCSALGPAWWRSDRRRAGRAVRPRQCRAAVRACDAFIHTARHTCKRAGAAWRAVKRRGVQPRAACSRHGSLPRRGGATPDDSRARARLVATDQSPSDQGLLADLAAWRFIS